MVVIIGLFVYFWSSRREFCYLLFISYIEVFSVAEDQGILDPQAPDYVDRRRDDESVTASSSESVRQTGDLIRVV